jgi:hypothetical protein
MIDLFFFLFFLLKADTTTIGWRTWIQRQEKRTMPMKPLGIPRGRNTRSECNAGGDTGGGARVGQSMIKHTRQQRRSVQSTKTKKSEYMQSLIDMYNIQYRREGTYTTREVGTFNPVFGGVSMHMPHNKAYKNSLNRFL